MMMTTSCQSRRREEQGKDRRAALANKEDASCFRRSGTTIKALGLL